MTQESSTQPLTYWPLSGDKVTTVLLICKGILTLEEGVDITGLPKEHLINEAEAWAIAEELNQQQ